MSLTKRKKIFFSSLDIERTHLKKNQNMEIQPIILCGGSGTRLWPHSRKHKPKQFLKLISRDNTLLSSTVERLKGLSEARLPWFVTTKQFKTQVDLPGHVVCEPCSRDTTAAVVCSTLEWMKLNTETMAENTVLFFLPSDHLIVETDLFAQSVVLARDVASTHDSIVLFGIRPNKPETGYGYIHIGEPLPGATHIAPIHRFEEKPTAAVAATYLADGNYLWNSGMLLFRPKLFLDWCERICPKILCACRKAVDEQWSLKAYEHIPKISLDYALLEPLSLHSNALLLLPLHLTWCDLGTFSSVVTYRLKDSKRNTSDTPEYTHFIDSEECHVTLDEASQKQEIVVAGCQNLTIIVTPGVICVYSKASQENVKQVLERVPDHLH